MVDTNICQVLGYAGGAIAGFYLGCTLGIDAVQYVNDMQQNGGVLEHIVQEHPLTTIAMTSVGSAASFALIFSNLGFVGDWIYEKITN